MTDTPELLSQLSYAKHRGCTHGAVQKAIKSGRLSRALVTVDGKVRIDPVVADVEWQANSNPAMQRKEPASKPAAPQRFDSLGILEPAVTPADPGEGTSMAEARAMKERYLALLAQLDYQVKAGVLIEAQAARKAAFEAARKARDMLLSIADRVAPVVAGMDNQFECHRVISTEVRRVLDELSSNPLDSVAPEAADAAGR